MSDDWIDELRSEPVDTEPRPGFKETLRAQLEHEWEQGSTPLTDSPRPGRRRWAVAAAAAAIAALVIGLVTITSDDAAVTPATVPDRVTTPSRASTSTTSTTSPPDIPAPDPIAIDSSSEFVVGDGVVLGAYVGDAFIPYSSGSSPSGPLFTAPPPPTGTDQSRDPGLVFLLDRTGEPAGYQVYDEGCGAIVVSPISGPLEGEASLGWQRTAERPIATTDGATEEHSDAIDEALSALGMGGTTLTSVERLTPSESLDADPSLETLLLRYLPVFDGSFSLQETSENLTWFAIWDPDTAEIRTIAGDPIGRARPFVINGEGPIDVDGDGTLETTITTGVSVELVRLVDGERLATARRCPEIYDRVGAVEFLRGDPRLSSSVFGFGWHELVDPVEVVDTVSAVLGEPDDDTSWQPVPDSIPCKRDNQYRSILWDDLRIVLEREPTGLANVGAWSVGDVDVPYFPPLAVEITESSGLTSASGLGLGSPKSAIEDEGFGMIGDQGDTVYAVAAAVPVNFQTPHDVISAFHISDIECYDPDEGP